MNVISLSGNLTEDPEVNDAGGTSVVNTTVAENHYKDQTNFIPIDIWGDNAENFAEYLSKGDAVEVVGTLEQGQYENDQGNTVTTFSVRVFRWSFVPSGGSGGDEGSDEFDDDDEVPF